MYKKQIYVLNILYKNIDLNSAIVVTSLGIGMLFLNGANTF